MCAWQECVFYYWNVLKRTVKSSWLSSNLYSCTVLLVKSVLKSQTIIVDLSISPCSLLVFASSILKLCYWMHKHLELFGLLMNWPLYNYKTLIYPCWYFFGLKYTIYIKLSFAWSYMVYLFKYSKTFNLFVFMFKVCFL